MKISNPKILAVGTAVPDTSFTQGQVATLLQVKSAKGLRFFEHPHIQKRHLSLPTSFETEKVFTAETSDQLLARFKKEALKISREAIADCVSKAGVSLNLIDFICCVTSTGFIVPALSALLVAELGLKDDCQRLDIVGMGCNAGLNGLNAVANWCRGNPSKNALLICCEVCSAIYSTDESEESALVNSLFGDGAAAALLNTAAPHAKTPVAEVLGSSSFMIPGTLDLLRFDYLAASQRYCFVVDKNTPGTLAAKIHIPVKQIFEKLKIDKTSVKHWVVHSGGEAILQGVQKSLGLTDKNLEHTRSVLKDFGNISSGSFLFSYSRLLSSGSIHAGDLGIMMTMGPGLTIEISGLRWVFADE